MRTSEHQLRRTDQSAPTGVRIHLFITIIGPSTVTLSAAKGLSRGAARCFAEFTLSAANWLSMTGLSPILMIGLFVNLHKHAACDIQSSRGRRPVRSTPDQAWS